MLVVFAKWVSRNGFMLELVSQNGCGWFLRMMAFSVWKFLLFTVLGELKVVVAMLKMGGDMEVGVGVANGLFGNGFQTVDGSPEWVYFQVVSHLVVFQKQTFGGPLKVSRSFVEVDFSYDLLSLVPQHFFFSCHKCRYKPVVEICH